ncbi:MAG: Mg(2+) transport ATPase, P-type [Frankiales bacterium]|nr:Mg(2+) transport ATPase, P-type [Frankiales bacterium]
MRIGPRNAETQLAHRPASIHPSHGRVEDGSSVGMPVAAAAARDPATVQAHLGSGADGLTAADVTRRRAECGPNAVRTHHARAWAVLGRQLRSALLLLLLVTATISFFLGERIDALVIGLILAASVGLGFVNEFRAERAAEALHSRVRHTAVVVRDGRPAAVDVVDLVPGDVVRLTLGQIVPADVRLIDVTGLECEESVLTGESLPATKRTAAVPVGSALADLRSCALMGTVVHAGAGTGIVVATGGRAEFGRIALGLGTRQPETDFQVGLRQFSMLLLQVALALTTLVFTMNLLLHRPFLDSLLFSLAIAVGITPQLLPAVVSTSLATGSRRLALLKVLVKRLVCIEDLGDLDVLVTDKTGTLTDGRIALAESVDASGAPADEPLRLGMLASEVDVVGDDVVGGNALDMALWQGARQRGTAAYDGTVIARLPFDHARRMVTALVSVPGGGRLLITKGAPETVLAACIDTTDEARAVVERRFDAGARVVAVACRPAPDVVAPTPADEQQLRLVGFLVFSDPVKPSAAAALQRLDELGIETKVATGDNPRVAQRLWADLGRPAGNVLTGPEIDDLDDPALLATARETALFARVSPEQKARLVRVLRHGGAAVGFLGDGVNDALALHAAAVGISVDSGADVAKDAADVVLLEKSLDVLADGVGEGRRIFANTMKYVLMGTSSNFGNMFSAAAASGLLPFLPMLPSQILLNNLLYDAGQLTIPTDRVDSEQLTRPSHWDIPQIRRFMLLFGPISSLFDFLTFAVMRGPLHAGPALFRSGWFLESLATQTLIIFAIRTRRVPFLRSRPSRPLTIAAFGTVTAGVALVTSPIAGTLGFVTPPPVFFLALAGMVLVYLVLVEVAKTFFFRGAMVRRPPPQARRDRRTHRRAARFTVARPLSATRRTALPRTIQRQLHPHNLRAGNRQL